MAVQASVDKLTSLTVKWIRGSKQRCETNIQRLNSYSSIVNYNETFTRDCQFYTSGNENYQEKFCTFEIREWGTDGKGVVIASKEFDMAPHVGKIDEKVKIKFPGSIFKDTELLISITILDPEKLRQSQLEKAQAQKQAKARKPSENVETKQMLQQLEEELAQLSKESEDLDSQIT